MLLWEEWQMETSTTQGDPKPLICDWGIFDPTPRVTSIFYAVDLGVISHS